MEFTRKAENFRSLTDLVLTSKSKLYVSSVIPVSFSDHYAMSGFRKLHRIRLPPPWFVDVRNYRNNDLALFKTDLHTILWDILELVNSSKALNEVWNSFKDMLLTVVDKHVPIVMCWVSGKSMPWPTPKLNNLTREREYYHKKAIKINDEVCFSYCDRNT